MKTISSNPEKFYGKSLRTCCKLMLRNASVKFALLAVFVLASSAMTKSFAQAASATWPLAANGTVTTTGAVTGTAVAIGSGITTATYAAATGISTTGWANDAGSLQNTEYYEYKVTATAGNKLTVTSVAFEHSVNTGSWIGAAYYSLNNFSTSTQMGGNFTSTTTAANFNFTGSVSVPTGTTFSVRVFAWESDGSNRNFRNRNLVINGTTCVPPVINTQPVGQSLCVGSALNLSVNASAATSYQWKKGGTNIPSATSSSYSIASVATGDAGTYTVDVINACQTLTSSNAVVTVSAQPTTTGSGGSASTCSNTPRVVSGITGSNGTISWIENGTGSITAGGTTASPTYTPGAGESGAVTLTMTVTNAPCTPATATYTINVTSAPAAAAGTALTMCSNDAPINITPGSSSSNNSGVTWTSNGPGTISNPNSMTAATYTPAPGEAGVVTLTLTATGNSPCANATSTKTLTVRGIPQATGVTICAGQSGLLTSSTSCPIGASVTSSPNISSVAVNATGVGSVAWVNPGNITTAGSPYATVNTSFSISNYLRATGYGFAIPAGSAINGIQLTINRQASSTSLGGVTDDTVRLLKAGTIVGDDNSDGDAIPTTMTAITYGGPANLWGTTWTPADINNANFGAVFAVGSLGNRTTTVDYMRITVTYQPPGSLNWYTVSSGGSAIGTGSSFNPVGVAGSGLANTNTAGTTTYYVECSSVIGCRTPVNFVINPLPVVSFSGLDASYCGTPNAIVLTGNHAPAGTFTGPGIINNGNGTATFNPATAGVGSHSIVYSYTDGNNCPNSAAQNVIVIAPTTYYADADGDGFGNPVVTEQNCTGPSVGYVANNTDCDDSILNYSDADGDGFGALPFVNCGGILSNTDCDDTVLNYLDSDGDGFGSTTYVNCGGVLNNTDCNDGDINVYQNVTFYIDADGDGYDNGTALLCSGASVPAGHSATTLGADCDDTNAAIFQSALLYTDADGDGYDAGSAITCYGSSVPAGLSLTSSGSDCNDSDAAVHANYPFYADNDSDTYGAGSLVNVCAVDGSTPPAGYSLDGTDCDDNNAAIFQSALLYTDADGDGYDVGSAVICYGASVPAGYSLTSNGSDCNDSNAAMHETFAFYADNDNDGFGAGSLVNVCAVDANTPPAGYSLSATDCNDNNPTMNTTFSFYADVDGDGYGAGSLVTGVCAMNATTPPANYSLNNTDCNDNIASVNPGASEILYDGVDNNCNNQFDEGFQMTTQLLPTSCGATLASIGSIIGITTLNAPITMYRIKVVNGASVQIVERNVPHFTLTSLAQYDYATTYTVSIELQYSGNWLGYYGPTCLVSSPAVLAENGASQVTPSQCGVTLAQLNTLVSTTSLQGVTGYRFRVTNITPGAAGPNVVQTLERSLHWFSLPMLVQYNYGATYRIEVAVKTNGVFSGYGSPCEVSSPAAPTLVNCGGVIATPSTLVAATSKPSVTQYRFQVIRLSDNATTTIDRNTNWFTFNMVPGYSSGAAYGVRVAVMTVGTWSTFGDICEITSPGMAGRFIQEDTAEVPAKSFTAVAYPNPFASSFEVGITTSATENVQMKVYDMAGKLIETRNVNASDANALEVGQSYPSGVYNVIVTQGKHVKTLRVIKR